MRKGPAETWFGTLLIQAVFGYSALLSCSSLLAAYQDQKGHPVKPTELLVAVGQADRIQVYSGIPRKILYTSMKPEDIPELRRAIAVRPPNGWFRCACVPAMDIVLARGVNDLGVISVNDDLTIGFSRRSGDAKPAKPDELLRWFDARGMTGLRARVEELRSIEQNDRVADERWLKALPFGVAAATEKDNAGLPLVN